MPPGDEPRSGSPHEPGDARREDQSPPPRPPSSADLPRSRRIPGDIGWRPDPADAQGGGLDEPGLALRLLSVAPFFIAGITGVLALVGWVFVFVLGVGTQPTIWAWARGRPSIEVAGQVALVLLLGLACAALTALAMIAALRGLRAAAGRRFWIVTQVTAGALAVAMVVVERRFPAFFDELGIGGWEWWLLFSVVALAMVTANLRMRRERAGHDRRLGRGEPSGREDRAGGRGAG